MSLSDILNSILLDLLQCKMKQNIDQNLVIVGPGEFHYSPAFNNEFARLQGDQTISREKLPSKFIDQGWKVLCVEDDDEFLDLYNLLVLNIKDVEHEEVL
jgi:hypothetical protein